MYAVKIAHFTQTNYDKGLVNADILGICNSLVEIIMICYSSASQRSPRQVLRLYNQCFIFGLLVNFIVGNPKKMTSRKFYGEHFQSLVTHFPETNRLFYLRSLIPEAEERTFGDIKNISLRTTNRQAKYIVDNFMLRLNAREKLDEEDKTASFKHQESSISKQARLLPPRGTTLIPCEIVTKRSIFMQAHCEKISDYLVCGKDVWWHVADGHIVFLDGPEEDESQPCGPFLAHFRTSTLKLEYAHLQKDWDFCMQKLSTNNFQIQCIKIKIFKEGKLSTVLTTDLQLETDTESSIRHAPIQNVPDNDLITDPPSEIREDEHEDGDKLPPNYSKDIQCESVTLLSDISENKESDVPATTAKHQLSRHHLTIQTKLDSNS